MMKIGGENRPAFYGISVAIKTLLGEFVLNHRNNDKKSAAQFFLRLGTLKLTNELFSPVLGLPVH